MHFEVEGKKYIWIYSFGSFRFYLFKIFKHIAVFTLLFKHATSQVVSSIQFNKKKLYLICSAKMEVIGGNIEWSNED